MSIPINKKELIEAIESNFANLKAELKSIPPNLVTKKDLPGHAQNTLMSVKDLIAYLTGWGQLILKWHIKKEKNEEVDFPETGYKWNQLGELAQKFYKDYESKNFNSLNAEFEETVVQILKLIQEKTNKELYQNPWYEKWTLGRMIQLNTSSPFQNARLRIRKWKKLQNLN
jgi:hypothetical protein